MKEDVDHLKADLKLKTFHSQMNTHFVFNTLNAIQHFVIAEDKKSVLSYLSTFSKLLRFYFNHIEKEKVLLKDEIEMLYWYLKLQNLRYHNQFEYQFVMEDETKEVEVSIPPYILQPLLEKIIDYVIYSRHTNSFIAVKFKITESFVKVRLLFEYSLNIDEKDAYLSHQKIFSAAWQNQIDQLKKVKNYFIQNEMFFDLSEERKRGTVELSLPNLSIIDAF